jgi:hypothetical protein
VHVGQQEEVSARKRRLLACACFRTVWHLLDPDARRAVETGERHADGQVTEEERRAAWELLNESVMVHVMQQDFEQAMHFREFRDLVDASVPLVRATWFAGYPSIVHRRVRKVLINHILCDPSRPSQAPDQWPSPVVKLAEALYAGEDCSFALHDALLEAGHTELAEHFREKDHPKGCWALDTLLGRN